MTTVDGELLAACAAPLELPDLAVILRTGVMALVYERPCPTCDVESDEPCIGPDGSELDNGHFIRYREMNGAGKSLVRALGVMAQSADVIARERGGVGVVDVLPDDPDPEPRFTIRAQDALALDTIAAYRRWCEDAGLAEQAAEVRKAWVEIAEWQSRNRDRVKNPDHAHVPVGET